MNVEIPRESYNAVAETSYIDITHWTVGERSRKVAERNPSLHEARCRFSAVSATFSDAPIAIMLPGTTGPADITFQDQIPVLQEQGLNVVLVDYSNSRFSSEMVRAQLTDFINSPLVGNRRINLVGFSLGTGSIFELLFRENETRERIDKVALLGSVFSSHDLANLIRRNAGRIPKAVTKRVAFLLRAVSTIDNDPVLTPTQVARIKKADRRIGRVSFGERIVSFLRERERIEQFVKRYGQIENADALLLRWQIDFTSRQRHDVMARAFAKSSIVTIPGEHGWTSKSAVEINTALREFLAS